jgi:hypothetical protein
MAQRVVTQLISDLSAEEIQDGKGETIAFSYRGVNYTIDLTNDEASGFDSAIAEYVANANRVGGRRRRAPGRPASEYSAKEVRTWAKEQGIEVPDRGRIPFEILEKYRAAH